MVAFGTDATPAPGFADAVFDAQATFRAVMDAMARPGTVRELPSIPDAPASLGSAASAIALTLCDLDTPMWLSPSHAATPGVVNFLRFHSGAPLVPTREASAFGFVANAAELGDLADYQQGTSAYPDQSTTVVMPVQGWSGGPRHWLQGPGIQDRTAFAPRGLPLDFALAWHRNRASFPQGVDLMLVCGKSVCCLPRSVRITVDSDRKSPKEST